jgi:plastocyanin
MTRKIILAMIVVLLIGISAASIEIQGARAATTVNITLYGSAGGIFNNTPPIGWGFSATSITRPGPTITINQYDYLNLTLYSQDGFEHQFFVDYNNNSAIDQGEPASPTFSSNTTGTVFGFNATKSGTFTYRCAIHPSMMYGTLIVQQAVPEFSPFLILPLFIIVTAVAAVAYRTKHSTKKMPSIAKSEKDSQQ